MSDERIDWGGRRAVLARRAGWIALAGGTAVIAYWTLFFAGAIESASPGSVVHDFELAFPVADALLAMAALAAGVGLIRRAPSGAFFLVVAGAMSLYLGFLDVAFYGRQGLYQPLWGAGGLELFLNLFCVVGGGYGLWVGRTLWNRVSEARAVRRTVVYRSPGVTETPRRRRHLRAG